MLQAGIQLLAKDCYLRTEGRYLGCARGVLQWGWLGGRGVRSGMAWHEARVEAGTEAESAPPGGPWVGGGGRKDTSVHQCARACCSDRYGPGGDDLALGDRSQVFCPQ